MKTYYEKDAQLKFLKGKKVAIIGYGSQGHAHALNLQDSGIDVRVGLAAGSPSRLKAQKAGLKVMDNKQAAKEADIVMMLVPDERGGAIYNEDIAPHLEEGDYLAFAHGFNIHFGQVVASPGVNVFMVAPKGPGHLVRNEFKNGRGVPCLVAVHQDPSKDTLQVALAYAKGLGGTRAGVLHTNFREETETDLFGEQVVLCGGLTSLMQSAYETLVEAGYAPEMAYFECIHEMKLIVDLIYEGGISNMRYSISTTAKYGDITRGPRIITDETRRVMKNTLKDIQSGEFAREWILENRAGRPVYNALMKRGEAHPSESIGAGLRKMMPWMESGKVVDKTKN